MDHVCHNSYCLVKTTSALKEKESFLKSKRKPGKMCLSLLKRVLYEKWEEICQSVPILIFLRRSNPLLLTLAERTLIRGGGGRKYSWDVLSNYFVLLCVTLYYFVLLSITLYCFVSLCNTLYYFVLLFITLYHFVLLCITLYYFVLLCITLIRGGGGRNNSWDGMLSPITSHYREKYSASKKWRPILNRISSGWCEYPDNGERAICEENHRSRTHRAWWWSDSQPVPHFRGYPGTSWLVEKVK